MLLKPKVRGNGPVQKFYDWFNRGFGRITDGYVGVCRFAIRKSMLSIVFLVGVAIAAGFFGKSVPAGFLLDEDQGYVFAAIQLPDASSLQRTSEVARQAEEIIMATPGREVRDDGGRLQHAQPSDEYLQRLLLRDAQGLE
jgi:HAE1 family hydrophobic/amphiphilic exporter-1